MKAGKALHIDFAPDSPRRRLHQIGMPTWCCLLLALIWLFALLLQHLSLQQQLALYSAQLQKAQAAMQARANVKPIILKTTVTESKAKAVNLAIAKMNLPWHDLFDALEAATPEHIALLSIEPDPKRRMLHASAEAKDSQAMALYLKNMRVAGFFDSVLLTRHEINEQDPNRPLRFQFEARWLIGFDMPEAGEPAFAASAAERAQEGQHE